MLVMVSYDADLKKKNNFIGKQESQITSVCYI